MWPSGSKGAPQRYRALLCLILLSAVVQSWFRRSSAPTWRTESTRSCHSVVLPTSQSQSASWHAQPGQPKWSRSCGSDFLMLQPVFRTWQKEFLRFRKSMAKIFASSVYTRRSMDRMHRSLITGYTSIVCLLCYRLALCRVVSVCYYRQNAHTA